MKAQEVAHKKATSTQKAVPQKKAPVMEKPVLEEKPQPQAEAKPAKTHQHHTIFGVHDHHQEAVNRLQHTDPDLWDRIRSWN